MRRLFIWMTLIMLGMGWLRAAAQQPTRAAPELRSPEAGQALQGRVPIYTRGLVPDLSSAEISFSYNEDRTNTWFLIAEVEGPQRVEKLADWDTTTITDGTYRLRVSILRTDGQRQEVTVPGLRVRNYSAIETPTPTLSPTPAPGLTPTPTPRPTPTITPIPPTATPLPGNPAQVSQQDVVDNMGRGALGVLAFFALMGGYASLRRLSGR
jgi:hypothetical protein